MKISESIIMLLMVVVLLYLCLLSRVSTKVIDNLKIQVDDNYALIEDLQTQLGNIDPVESLISQGEETEPGQHVFQYEEDGITKTGAVLNTDLMDMDEFLLGRE